MLGLNPDRPLNIKVSCRKDPDRLPPASNMEVMQIRSV